LTLGSSLNKIIILAHLKARVQGRKHAVQLDATMVSLGFYTTNKGLV